MSLTNQPTFSEPNPPPVTKLTPGWHDAGPVEDLQATLEYALSPNDYLVRRLGKEVIEERAKKGLLSLLPAPVDRDRYGKGAHKQHFEQHIANLLGKHHGLFFITGVQAQLAALKIHCVQAQNHRVAWHARSHLEIAEERAFAEVFGLQRVFLGTSPLEVPAVADVEALTSRPVEKRPAVLLLELPNRELGCKTYPWDDLVEIAKLCKDANVRLHMDGARLWDIEPFYHALHGKSFVDLAQLFDSVYVSMYKGLEGACGAMLTSSDEEFISEAKIWQRRLGGNMVTSYSEVIDCERGFNLHIGTFDRAWKKMCAVAAAITDTTKEFRTKDGKPLVFFDLFPTCNLVHTHIQGVTAEQLIAARDEVEKIHHIRVFESTRPYKSFEEQSRSIQISVGEEAKLKEGPVLEHRFVEWMIFDVNIHIPDDVFAKGWKALCQHLVASL